MRETHREAQIPDATELPKYHDAREIVRRFGKHLPEVFLGSVTGAGGVGGDLENVPFEPAIVEVINAAGATPAHAKSVFPDTGTAQHILITAAVANNGNPPTLTQVAENDWTIGLPTQLAPNGETVFVIAYGFRADGGSL